ncbi:MAG TPA: NAD(P)/FAD-dependent oxidoreductase [Chthonomonadaceae bacterium]|nr:NAD(P)/FAD-dependent oxidoreductase [Chthonomonadaceae bacterium]
MTDTQERNQSDDDLYDVTIIGGGPVGLFGAFYAGMRQMKTKIVDSLPELGGQLTALYPEKYIYDMPGFPKVLARDLVAEMAAQGTRFNPAVCLAEKVQTLRYEEDETITLTSDKAVHRTRTVIIAIGAGAFYPKRLGTPGVEEFEGRGIHYFVQNKAQFTGKRLLIVGGGDSALDWAMNLEPVAEKITLIHRRDEFRAHEESVDWLLNRSQIEVKLWHELRRVEGNGHVQQAVVFHNKTQEETALPVDAVLLNLGFSTDIGPVKEWGLNLHGRDIEVNSHMETNLPGVYAAGDIAAYDGKLKLIATGVGEICVAVNYAKNRINPKEKIFPGHSSNMDFGAAK